MYFSLKEPPLQFGQEDLLLFFLWDGRLKSQEPQTKVYLDVTFSLKSTSPHLFPLHPIDKAIDLQTSSCEELPLISQLPALCLYFQRQQIHQPIAQVLTHIFDAH